MADHDTSKAPEDDDGETDIVLAILAQVRAARPDITEEELQCVEVEARKRFGGQRFRVPKRRRHMNAGEREAARQQGMSAKSTDQVTRETGISRATLYRLLKK